MVQDQIPGRNTLESIEGRAIPNTSNEAHSLEARLRLAFWLAGGILATMQALAFRHYISADGISYLDMSDAVFLGVAWQRIITGTWSPLYPFLLGLCRLLSPNPYNELVIGHLFNIVIFLFAFAAFEYLFHSVAPEEPTLAKGIVFLPRWFYFVVAYTVFLWATIAQITLRSLRPDMLMAAFLFLAMGILCRIRRGPAAWTHYFALGVTLGLGYLAKAPMLVMAALILASSLLASRERLRALPKVAFSAVLFLLIGSLYFVPLSLKRGHLTFGDSGNLNYLLYVDDATPKWYLQDPGKGSGIFLHRAIRIFEQPPVYAFSMNEPVSYPMRYDPAYWIEGVRPRFCLSDQLRALAINLREYWRIAKGTCAVTAAIVLLWILARHGMSVLATLGRHWPLWFVGLSGLAMYALVHVEPRYVGVFFLLLLMGLLYGPNVGQRQPKYVAPVVVVCVAASILVPMAWSLALDLVSSRQEPNVDADVARKLVSIGIHAGDRIARISPNPNDYTFAHMLNVTIVTEVDLSHTREFWNADSAVKDSVLQTMATAGARMVIAFVPGTATPPGWQRLGTTPFCIRWLDRT